MALLSYPGEQFAAPPALGIEIPDGWVGLPEVGLPIAAGRPVEDGRFMPNVVVTVQRMRAGTALVAAIDELHARIRTLTDYAMIGEEACPVAGFSGFRVEGSFRDAEAGTLLQGIRLAVVPRGPVEDLVQITATCGADLAEQVWPEIRGIQDSLRVVP